MKREEKANRGRLSISTTQFLVYVVILIFASCEAPVTYLPVMQSTVPPIIIPMEEKKMIIKPITEYQNYVVNNGNVKGILGKELIPVVLSDGEMEYKPDVFFTVSGTVYFSIMRMEPGSEVVPDSDPVQYVPEEVLHCFSQKDGEVSEFVAYADFPEIPESTFITMDSPPYKIETIKYNGDDVSNVLKATLRIGYLQIDSYSLVDDGLYFSVSIGTKGRESGVHYWDSNSQGTIKKCDGKIW